MKRFIQRMNYIHNRGEVIHMNGQTRVAQFFFFILAEKGFSSKSSSGFNPIKTPDVLLQAMGCLIPNFLTLSVHASVHANQKEFKRIGELLGNLIGKGSELKHFSL